MKALIEFIWLTVFAYKEIDIQHSIIVGSNMMDIMKITLKSHATIVPMVII